jgi:hypothetical protein
MHEDVAPAGRLRITLIDPATGGLVLERRHSNLVTLVGRQLLAEMLTGAKAYKAMELVVGGPDETTPTIPEEQLEDQDLENPKKTVDVQIAPPGEQPVDGAPRIVTAISGTLPAEPGGEDIVMTEAGIRVTRDDDSKVLYNRVVFPVITKQADLQMTLTWDVIF